jgi:hypothetical protein
VTNPKADCATLMNAVLPFAEQMLSRHGEFVPFGGAMRPSGELVSVAGYDGNEHPPSTEVIRLLRECFVDAARKNEYKATAVVYDARVTLPPTEENCDAIAVSLNHRDGYSVVVFFPYKLTDGKLEIGTVFAQKGGADVFENR